MHLFSNFSRLTSVVKELSLGNQYSGGHTPLRNAPGQHAAPDKSPKSLSSTSLPEFSQRRNRRKDPQKLLPPPRIARTSAPPAFCANRFFRVHKIRSPSCGLPALD